MELGGILHHLYLSFGFAPNSNIKQLSVDVFDCDSSNINCKDSNRLSWPITGGWILGNIHCIKYMVY
jgi:hypothetical protein